MAVLVGVRVLVAVGVGVPHINCIDRRRPACSPPEPPLHTNTVDWLPVSFCTPTVELLFGLANIPYRISNS